MAMPANELLACQIEAIQELAQCDHAFLSEEGVKRFTEPFGFVGFSYEAGDSREHMKGLSLDTGPGSTMKGQDAAETALEIAKHVIGKRWRPFCQGRGSRLQECCRAVLEHLQTK